MKNIKIDALLEIKKEEGNNEENKEYYYFIEHMDELNSRNYDDFHGYQINQRVSDIFVKALRITEVTEKDFSSLDFKQKTDVIKVAVKIYEDTRGDQPLEFSIMRELLYKFHDFSSKEEIGYLNKIFYIENLSNVLLLEKDNNGYFISFDSYSLSMNLGIEYETLSMIKALVKQIPDAFISLKYSNNIIEWVLKKDFEFITPEEIKEFFNVLLYTEVEKIKKYKDSYIRFYGSNGIHVNKKQVLELSNSFFRHKKLSHTLEEKSVQKKSKKKI